MDDAEEVFLDDFQYLDTGGFGTIFQHKTRKPPTVLKSIQEKHENNDHILLKEVQALRILDHEHIVKYYGLAKFVLKPGETPNFGILMEYCERKSLRDWLYKKTLIYSIKTVIWWARQLFSALKYLEAKKIVHRDLKPANLLVCGDFQLKICDFGTTKVNDRTCTTYSVVGTCRYMSPEQCETQKRQISLRSDVYSMGLVLWEMIERSCTKFDLKQRLKASEILVLLLSLEQDFNEHDFPIVPEIDESQKKLLKPIGFDGHKERRVTVEESEELMHELSAVFKRKVSTVTNDWERVGMSISGVQSLNTFASLTDFPYIRGAYFTNWSHYRGGCAKFVPSYYLPGLCTHLFYAFAVFGLDFKLREWDENDLDSANGSSGLYTLITNLKEKQPGLKIMLAIGGALFDSRLFEKMSSEQFNRRTFILSAISWVRQHNFDGIDLCWIHPKNHHYPDYAKLLTELRDEIDFEAVHHSREKLLLSAAVLPIAHIMEAYDVESMAKSLDFVNLLTWEYWNSAVHDTIGMNSPLHSRQGLIAQRADHNISWAANEWHQRGFSKEKIIIGVPTFGHGWNIKDPTIPALGSHFNTPTAALPGSGLESYIAYYEICDLLDKGEKADWHDEHKVPWLEENGRFWSYDDPRSMALKMEFIKTNGFGGAIAWNLDFDDFLGRSKQHEGQKYPLITTIARELGGFEIQPD